MSFIFFNQENLSAQTYSSTNQESSLTINLPEFLVGMFNDYNGKEFIPDHPKESMLITDFFVSDSNAAQIFIDSINVLAEQTRSSVDVTREKSITIYSSELSDLFRAFYTIEKKPQEFYIDNSNSSVEYGIYRAKLKRGKFNTRLKKLSFLLGVVIRYGTFADEKKIKLSFSNSPNHYKISKRFFKSLNFKITDTQNCKQGYVPCIRSYTVKINKKYQDYFNHIYRIETKLR